MDLLAKKLGIKVDYITGPSWNEFLGLIKRKELAVMLNIAKTEDRMLESFTFKVTRVPSAEEGLEEIQKRSHYRHDGARMPWPVMNKRALKRE